MSRYDSLQNRMVGIAFILGPLLMLAAALSVTFEIGVNDGGQESAVDGVLLAYSMVCFVAINLTLSRVIGERSPRFGIFMAVLSLLGALGIAAGVVRIFEGVLLDSGGTLDADIWEAVTASEFMFLALAGAIFPFAMIIFGIALLRASQISTLSAILISVGGVFFVMAQAATFIIEVTYPLAALSWLIALAPIGLNLLQKPTAGYVSKSA